MGYTHYWRTRNGVLDTTQFLRFQRDALLVVKTAAGLGVPVAGPDGEGQPEVTDDVFSFNGVETCGHPHNARIVIPWPASIASGVGDSTDAHAGEWFAGATLSARTCGGSCSYETCRIERVNTGNDGDGVGRSSYEVGRIFGFCKTAYRPYDLVVTAVLLLYRHHFPQEVTLSSDGGREHWLEGQHLVWMSCGFTPEIMFREEE